MKNRLRIRNVSGVALGTLTMLFALAMVPAQAKEELVLYTASNSTIEKDVMAAFQKKYPDIDVQSINMSTGPITERAIAEKANPQADIIWMVNDIALEQLKGAGVLEPYEPKGSAIDDAFKDPDGFYMGHNATVMGMAVNIKLLEEKKLPMPKSWDDLIKPVYKGQITVAAPTKSGTGLSIFSTMHDAFGWNFIDNLHQNIFQYNSSGSAAARQTGSGETVIGLSYDTAILQQVTAGMPVELVVGNISPNVIEGAGLIAGAPHPAEAKLFLDWLFSEEGAKVLAPHVGIGAVPGYGNIDLSKVSLWKMRRPLDAKEFKREWAAKYEQ
ncbi:MAG: extracellular solute-binding protein [Gammaproteobacteria bacterium]|nr:MAG: extracellular solute-binding protein [Gammaproteobacteria bacterium]